MTNPDPTTPINPAGMSNAAPIDLSDFQQTTKSAATNVAIDRYGITRTIDQYGIEFISVTKMAAG